MLPDSTCPNKDKCRVKRHIGEEGEVVKCIFLGPGPHSDSQDAKANEPKDDIETENDIFEAARDLTVIPPPVAWPETVTTGNEVWIRGE